MDLSKVTQSAFAASRKSNNYTLAQMNAGFGPDTSFQVVDSAGVTKELGVMGMVMTGDGSANADFVFKTWNGQAEEANFAAMDAAGEFNRLVIKSNGDMLVPNGELLVQGESFRGISAKISDLEDDYDFILTLSCWSRSHRVQKCAWEAQLVTVQNTVPHQLPLLQVCFSGCQCYHHGCEGAE